MQQKSNFEEIVNEYQSMVYNTVIGFVQHAEDAEDVTQDVFVQVYESWERFKGESLLKTWIYRIAVNKSLDFLRRKKTRGGWWKWLKPGEEETDESFHHPGVSLSRKEDAAVLFKAMDKLPAQQKAAFVLQKLEGLTVKEIAVVLKLSDKAAESLLGRANKNLQSYLEVYFKNNY